MSGQYNPGRPSDPYSKCSNIRSPVDQDDISQTSRTHRSPPPFAGTCLHHLPELPAEKIEAREPELRRHLTHASVGLRQPSPARMRECVWICTSDDPCPALSRRDRCKTSRQQTRKPRHSRPAVHAGAKKAGARGGSGFKEGSTNVEPENVALSKATRRSPN